MAERLLHAFGSTLLVFAAVLLPTVAGCVLLSLLSAWQRGMLLRTFGWKSLLLTGWLGTPIHELSHAVAALLFGHQITELRLFRPNPVTGQLGHVKHTYNPRNPYAAILGNAIIPIAPLFGGALAMVALTLLLAPEFLPGTAVTGEPIRARQTSSIPSEIDDVELRPEATSYVRHFLRVLTSAETWRRWQFYVYLYAVFCIAMYLSPSRQDFHNFAKPALLLSLATLMVIFAIMLVGGPPKGLPPFVQLPLATINGLLAFAIVVSSVGAALLAATAFLVGHARR